MPKLREGQPRKSFFEHEHFQAGLRRLPEPVKPVRTRMVRPIIAPPEPRRGNPRPSVWNCSRSPPPTLLRGMAGEQIDQGASAPIKRGAPKSRIREYISGVK